MKLASLSIALVAAAACGGKSKPTTPGNTSTAGANGASGVPAEWAAVLVEGAHFTLDNQAPDSPREDPMTIVAIVEHVAHDGDATTADIRWTDGSTGEDIGASGLPVMVKVSPAGVWFWTGGEEPEVVMKGPPTYPAGAEKTHRDGYYDTVRRDPDGAVCYGWEPDENAGECEDVCFAQLCLSPTGGIVEGDGNWWPNMEIFHQTAK